MNEHDALEQAYKKGYSEGFRSGLNEIEKWLREYPIQTVLEFLSNKETLIWDLFGR